jgi:hypothetical protein
MGQDALHLARADHARLVDHQHVARREQVAPLAQPCSMLAMVRDAMPEPFSSPRRRCPTAPRRAR